MTLELLANELLLELFEYLPVVDLFHAFVGLNTRFNTLLFNQYCKHRLDFRSVSKRDFDLVCQRYLPLIIDRTNSLCLSDDDETPDQMNCFLSHSWTLRQFIYLQSLTLNHLHSDVVMCKLMVECEHLHNLIYLNINKCKFHHSNKEICQFLSNIWSLPKLTHCYLDISFKEHVLYFINPSIISTSLQYLTIKSMSYRLTHLAHLFQCTPYLRYLDINESDYSYATPLSIPMTSIIKLKLEVFDSLRVLTNLLQNMPNLRHLTVKTADIDMNGHQWEHIIVNHLLKLQVFRLEMKFYLRNNEDKEQRVNELLKSFQTRFWLEEHQWFVQCDWDRCQKECCSNQIYLYTLPYSFNSYDIHDLTIKAKSTCLDNDIYPSYNQVHILNYDIAPSENRELSQFTFFNIHDLILYLPIDDNFWSMLPQFDHLKSLKVSPYDTDQHDFDSQFQLQTILDRAPRLYSLGFHGCSSISMGMPPFEYSNRSVRRLDLQDVDRVYDSQQCVTLSRSSLGMQCEVLSITVKNRTTIIDLLNTMPNLRALNVLSRDDSWTNENDDNSSSENDEPVEWLQRCLPSTYTITRNNEEIFHWRSLKSFWSVLLWIS